MGSPAERTFNERIGTPRRIDAYALEHAGRYTEVKTGGKPSTSKKHIPVSTAKSRGQATMNNQLQSFAPGFQAIPEDMPTGIETANAVRLRNPPPQDAERRPIEGAQMGNSANENKQNISYAVGHFEQYDLTVNASPHELSDCSAMSSWSVCTDYAL